jgi:glycosyltransferase involved in cell wall biosynthesis
MDLMRQLRRAARVHFYAGKRFRPDIAPDSRSLELAARYMSVGSYPVIYTTSTAFAPIGIANHIGRAMRKRQALFLLMFSWTHENKNTAHRLATAVLVYLKRRPNHQIIVLCNTIAELELFASEGIETIFCNQNALCVDEDVFYPLQTERRIYDAVYNGAMVHWKRHDLASLIDHCAHIFYQRSDFDRSQTLALLDEMRKLMPKHDFINPVSDNIIQEICAAEVNEILNKSCVGLCLSASEGAMLASMEYLLAGLPVVSTHSKGGRDVFADPRYWLTVGDNAEDVRNGVIEMCGRDLDRSFIRAKTIEKIHEHRERLRVTVASCTEGKAQLPVDLGDSVYRRPIVWKNGAELAYGILSAAR